MIVVLRFGRKGTNNFSYMQEQHEKKRHEDAFFCYWLLALVAEPEFAVAEFHDNGFRLIDFAGDDGFRQFVQHKAL